MRLYSLMGADSHVTPDGTRYTPDDAGGFDFPDASMLTAMEENTALTRKVTELMAMLAAAQLAQAPVPAAPAPAEVPADPGPAPVPVPDKAARTPKTAAKAAPAAA
jgi:hypothetical protein